MSMAPLAACDPDYRRELRTRVLLDLGSQNLISLILYPVLWLVLVLQANLLAVDPKFFWINLGILIVSTTFRCLVHVRIRRCPPSKAATAERLLVAAVLLNASHWSAMTFWALRDPALHSIRLAMLFIGTGMIGSGTFAVAFNTALRIFFPTILAAPAGLMLVLSGEPVDRMLGVLTFAYLAYILAASRQRQQDYFKAIGLTILLEQRSRELEQISFNDPVTGLRNRSYFDAHYELEWKRAQRQHYPLSAFVIDLDNFKAINDRHGHQAGDRCLAAVGACLNQAQRRTGDILARLGGDEFIVLLVNTDAAAAEQIADDINVAVRNASVMERGTPIPLTVSIGVVTDIPLVPSLDAATDFLARGDAALYAAKAAGRNQWQRAIDGVRLTCVAEELTQASGYACT